MRRIVAVAGLALLPVIAWRAASAEPDPPPDCNVPTTEAPEECVAPAPAAPVDPVAGSDVSTTTTLDPSSTVVASSTTIDPNAPTTTVDPDAPTTTVDPNATTTSTGVSTTTTTDPGATTTDPAATTTTTIDPGSTTTTVDPNASTTTVVDPNATTTTVVDPNATTTTLDPLLVEDSDSEPVLPPVEAPGGRVVLPAGVVETGQTRSITFPVAGPVTYGNDWGACRDGCARAHKGIDIIGDRLQPILAMHDGVIDHLVDHPTAGNGVAIRDDEGWEYHVYHVNNDTPGTDDGADPAAWRYAPGIEAGVRVTAGQLIGWMGDSGNSEGSVPHAHVEIHVPGGQAVNPYWSLRQAQRDVNCAVGTVEEIDPAVPVDADWLRTGWDSTTLPVGWQPLTLTGGRPGSGATNARMWIAAAGFTPVDSAALRAGDARYDAGVDCATSVEPQLVAPVPTELGAILSTIRAMESGGDYTVSVTTSTASGAYGFLDSSWGGYGGYRRARDAPPAVQDAKAAELAAYVLARNGGDVSTIPVSWYIGHVPVGAEWDTVPPYPGNRLTPREYQDRWMKRYAAFLGTPEAWVSGPSATWIPADTSATCRTVVVDEGQPGAPQYVLTQAQAFVGDASGRAALDVADPCDPARAVPVAAPTVDGAAEPGRDDDGAR